MWTHKTVSHPVAFTHTHKTPKTQYSTMASSSVPFSPTHTSCIRARGWISPLPREYRTRKMPKPSHVKKGQKKKESEYNNNNSWYQLNSPSSPHSAGNTPRRFGLNKHLFGWSSVHGQRWTYGQKRGGEAIQFEVEPLSLQVHNHNTTKLKKTPAVGEGGDQTEISPHWTRHATPLSPHPKPDPTSLATLNTQYSFRHHPI